MGLLTPGQNFEHLLDVISGYDGMHDLQYKAPPAAAADWRRGSLVSLDAAGDFVAGLDVSHAMPIWTFNDTGDFDVNSDVGNISGGVVAGYPATGGYELVTTEYDVADVVPLAVPNAPIIDAGAGLVGAGAVPVLAAESIVGVVSAGIRNEVYGQSVLQFWPVYLPARA
jgi:hypothetical protein